MMRIHANSHSVGGCLGADADIKELKYPIGGTKTHRIRFRIACNEVTRRSAGQVSHRVTWFNIRLDTSEKGVAYFEPKLKKGVEVFIVGKQLIDEIEDDRGRRFFHFLAAHEVNVLSEPARPSSAQRPSKGRRPVPKSAGSEPAPKATPLPDTGRPSPLPKPKVDPEKLKASLTW